MTSPTRLSLRDTGLLALVTFAWGVNWPMMKIGVSGTAPMTFRVMCMASAVPLVGIVARAMGIPLRVPRRDFGELLVLVLTNTVLWIVLTAYGLELISSGRAAILGYTMPIWAAVIGILLYDEHPSRRLWVGVCAVAVGVLLLLANESTAMLGAPIGTVIVLTASIIWGYGTHRMRRRRTLVPVLAITFWSLLATLVVCLLLAWGFERAALTTMPGSDVWAAAAFNAVVCFAFAQPAWFRLATILTPVASGLSIMLIPAVGLFSSMAILGEQASWVDYAALGAVLVALGSVMLPPGGRRLRAASS